jgi:hypothetical protein
MALHPKVQARAQAEIDEICGQGLTPRTSQVELLAYLQAVLKEVLRFAPVGNLGGLHSPIRGSTVVLIDKLANRILALPHKVIEDDVYLGYKIPKNATIIGNVW